MGNNCLTGMRFYFGVMNMFWNQIDVVAVNVLNATELLILKWLILGFPSGAVVKNLPAKAGDTGSSPGPGISHMPRSNWAREPQLLSLRSRAYEPQLLSPRAQSPCSATREATAMRSPRTTTDSSPRSPQLEKDCTQQRRPNADKNK